MSDLKIDIGTFDEPKPERTIQEAGIYTGFTIAEIKYMPPTPEVQAEPAADGKPEVKAKKAVGASLAFSLVSDAGFKYDARKFLPPVSEANVKYVGKKYENNVPIRDLTPKEQLESDWGEFTMFLGQLGLAMGHPWASIRSVLMPLVGKGQEMCEAFIKAFCLNKVQKKINFKLLWNNNDKNQTSFLQLPKAGSKSLVFEQHIPGQASMLAIAKWETEKGMDKCTYKFKPTSKNGVEVSKDSLPGGFKPVVSADGSDAELF